MENTQITNTELLQGLRDNGITFTEVAEKSGLSYSTVRKTLIYGSRHNQLAIETAKKMLAAKIEANRVYEQALTAA